MAKEMPIWYKISIDREGYPIPVIEKVRAESNSGNFIYVNAKKLYKVSKRHRVFPTWEEAKRSLVAIAEARVELSEYVLSKVKKVKKDKK